MIVLIFLPGTVFKLGGGYVMNYTLVGPLFSYFYVSGTSQNTFPVWNVFGKFRRIMFYENSVFLEVSS